MPSNPKNTRRCIACRAHSDKSELIRIARTADGVFIIDEASSAAGRGAYVHNRAECLEKTKKKKLLNAAFKCAVPEEIYQKL